MKSRFLLPLGLFAGFIDASGGGGWGPVTTPTMLSTLDQAEPRKIVGTVSAAEFVVTVCASAGFVLNASTNGLDWHVILGLLVGGVVMAPFAAKLAGRLPHQPFGVLIGGMVILTNARSLMVVSEISGPTRLSVLLLIGSVSLGLAFLAWKREKRLGIERSFFERADS